MPRVTQASIPSARTPRTIDSTRSNCSPRLASRQAAPMQKRVAPASLALRAATSTSSTGKSASALVPVL